MSSNQREAATSAHRARIGLRPHAPERVDGTSRRPLSGPARAFWLASVLAALAAVAATLPDASAPSLESWLRFGSLALAAAVAQYLIISTGRNQAFALTTVFLIASALLLPAELVAFMALAQHAPEYVRSRFRRYITVFNVANFTLATLAAWGAYTLIRHAGFEERLRWAVAATAAAIVFVVVNHLSLALMLRLARNRTLRGSGLFALQGLLGDFAPAAIGVVMARSWLVNPYLIPLLLAPLALIQQSFFLVAQLTESEERFRAMFECAPVGTMMIDLDDRIVSANRAVEQLLGCDEEDLVGRRLGDFLDGSGFVRRLIDADGEEAHNFEGTLRRRDGTSALAHIAVALVRDAQTLPRFAILMAEDLTERRQLEEQLRQAQKMEAVGELAGGVAHDFNNLLTIISGRARTALRLTGDHGRLKADVEEIAAAAERAATLTRQLLAFGRRQVLQPRVFDLNAVVASTDRMLRRLIGEHIEIVLDLAPAVGRVRADPSQLEQVLINLAVNARDAMRAGGRLTIRTFRDELDGDDYAVFSMSDTGAGMDEQTRSHIFEPFFTTKEPGRGTGLGLATVHGIVAQSGGLVRVESRPGEGSTFTVYLPRVEDEAEAPEGAPSPAGAIGGTETVLLVEDDDGVRALAELLLTEAGYHVLAASDGNDALKLAERHSGRIDALLTDVVMPGLGGVALAETVERLRPGIGIVFMSGYPGDALAGVTGSGGARTVAKPFTVETLLRPVREALDAAAAATTSR
jgi:PAS domain S-box-containing protein